MTADAADGAEWGPKMAALATDKQRAFVVALFLAPRKIGAQLFAARVAGFGTERSSNKSLAAIASRLMADARIQAAIAEESVKRLRGLGPRAVAAVEGLVNNPAHRDHGRAVAMVLDRTDPLSSLHRVEVSDTRRPAGDVEKVMAKIDELASRLGVSALPAPKIIEGTAVHVDEGAA